MTHAHDAWSACGHITPKRKVVDPRKTKNGINAGVSDQFHHRAGYGTHVVLAHCH
jgi:hypothetical protein